MCFRFILIVLACLFLQTYPQEGMDEDIDTCEGYIELMSDTGIEVDFSQIKVKKLSLQRIVKEVAICEPNGYYVIPVYDKKPFILQVEGPPGSKFLPDSAEIHNYKEDCKKVSFKFQGFNLHGQVKSYGSEEGPSGFRVELYPRNNFNHLIASTYSTEGGLYSFETVYPGNYTILGNDPNFNVHPSHSRIDCVLNWNYIETCSQTNIIVKGYNIKGSVSQPLQGLLLFLYSNEKKSNFNCPNFDALKGEAKEIENLFLVCGIKTSESESSFKFADIPFGNYRVTPYFEDLNKNFEISPESIEVEITHSDYIIPDPFEVISFSISGRVENGKHHGIENVRILVDSEEKALTDANGYYKLSSMRTGTYSIEGLHEHYVFEPMSPQMGAHLSQLPTMVATHYKLCGVLTIDDDDKEKFESDRRSVILKKVKKREEFRTTTNAKGKFCFEVEAGEYTVIPYVKPQEKERGLYLHPNTHNVDLTHLPILDLRFNQIKVDISGNIICLHSNCRDVIIVLKSLIHGEKKETLISSVEDGKGIFKFEKQLPGEYEVQIIKKEFCWERERIKISVKDKDYENIEFVQNGFSMEYRVKHKTRIAITHEETGKTNYNTLEPNLKHLCLDLKGKYIVVPETCYKFEKDEFIFDTNEPDIIELLPTDYSISGHVELHTAGELENLHSMAKIKVNTLSKTGEKETFLVDLKKDKKTEGRGLGSFSFQFFSKGLREVELIPYPLPEIAESTSMLFYPQQLKVMMRTECIEKQVFEVRKGLMVSGKVLPPTEGVQIAVTDITECQQQALPQCEPSVMAFTDTQGFYKVGPLYDNHKYSIDAFKQGYKVTRSQQNQYDFDAQELSSLSVKITHNQQPSPGVFLILKDSSSKEYSNRTYSDINGEAYFTDLNPGKYYLRPLLKEYIFDPPSASLVAQNGKKMTQTFEAKRVAFSAIGEVSILSKKKIQNATVEAKCLTCTEQLFEDSQTDKDGKFRIRGLEPQNAYSLSVKINPEESQITKASPKEIIINVEEEDIAGIEFLAFLNPEHVSISGIVQFEKEPFQDLQNNPKVRLELYDEKHLDRPIFSRALNNTRIFRFDGLKKGEYILKAIPVKEQANQYSVGTERLFLTTYQGSSEFYLNLTLPSLFQTKQSASRSGLLAPLFLIGLIFLFYNFEKVKQSFAKFFRKSRRH